MRLALLLLAAANVWAQEIRGTVVELGPATGIPGAAVTVTWIVPAPDGVDERVVGTKLTDEFGRFSFILDALGEYRVAVSKPGYQNTRPAYVRLRPEAPTWELRPGLSNPGTLTGQFIDDDSRPIAGLTVFFTASSLQVGPPRNIVTAEDGSFRAEGMLPGQYLVLAARVLPESSRVQPYSEAEFAKVDRDYENLLWPGGAANERDALPVTLLPGGAASIGTVRLRQVDYYRVHVRIEGGCGGQWNFGLQRLPRRPNTQDLSRYTADCRPDLLLPRVAPGRYELALWKGEDAGEWALAPFTVTNRNVEVTLRMQPAQDLTARFVAAGGTRLPPPGALVLLRDEGRIGPIPNPVADGGEEIRYRGLAWPRYLISLPRLPATHYVREIRYAGQRVPDGRITLAQGGVLEIELDDRPASITGAVTQGGRPAADRYMVFLARTPVDAERLLEASAPFAYNTPLESEGHFAFGGLAPGEYRLAVISAEQVLPLVTAGRLAEVVDAGQRVTLERGQQRSVEIKLP